MAARSLFQEDNLSITAEALLAPAHRVPLTQIRAVRTLAWREWRLAATLAALGLALAGYGAATRGGPALAVGVMLAVVGWLAWLTQAWTHRILITTDEGEIAVYETRDADQAQRIVHIVRTAR